MASRTRWKHKVYHFVLATFRSCETVPLPNPDKRIIHNLSKGHHQDVKPFQVSIWLRRRGHEGSLR